MLSPWHYVLAAVAVGAFILGVLAYRGPNREAGYQISVIGVIGILLAIIVEFVRRVHGIR